MAEDVLVSAVVHRALRPLISVDALDFEVLVDDVGDITVDLEFAKLLV